jgi:flagellar assembly factor FliW
MKLTTPRFGTLVFGEEQMLLFESGILSAPQRSHFVVINALEEAPFQWLVCVEQPECALTVLDPVVVLNDTSPSPDNSLDTSTFVVATPGSGAVAWWLDLRHPILIDTAQRTGEQVTLDDTTLPERFPVTLQQSYETAE